jgi:hypothetical protein
MGNQAALRAHDAWEATDLQPTLPSLRLIPIAHPAPSSIPRLGGMEDEVDAVPDDGGATPAGPGPQPGPVDGGTPTADTDGCGTPRSMEKVTSGAFKGGLTVDSYFPDLASRHYPAQAGPFDLGNRAGSSVQLLGVIPSPCRPQQYTLGQQAHCTRARRNGTPYAMEGTTFDDVAQSGRSVSASPLRQEFLGGGTAPLGYIISMLDPPSFPYSASVTSGEYDLSLTTSLTGPAGSKSVDWSVSVRVTNGSVTRNTVT